MCIFKVLHYKIDCSLANLGLTLLQSKTRGNNLNFVQRRATSKLCASLFPHSAASSWNKLPLNVYNVKSIYSFKQSVYKYLHDCAKWQLTLNSLCLVILFLFFLSDCQHLILFIFNLHACMSIGWGYIFVRSGF